MKGEITYELKDQAFCYTILEVPNNICSLAAQLTKWLWEVETCKVTGLFHVFSWFLLNRGAIHFLYILHQLV